LKRFQEQKDEKEKWKKFFSTKNLIFMNLFSISTGFGIWDFSGTPC